MKEEHGGRGLRDGRTKCIPMRNFPHGFLIWFLFAFIISSSFAEFGGTAFFFVGGGQWVKFKGNRRLLYLLNTFINTLLLQYIFLN